MERNIQEPKCREVADRRGHPPEWMLSFHSSDSQRAPRGSTRNKGALLLLRIYESQPMTNRSTEYSKGMYWAAFLACSRRL